MNLFGHLHGSGKENGDSRNLLIINNDHLSKKKE